MAIRLHKRLESGLEATVRMMVRKFDLRLIIQGNRCCTDGKTIWLPMIEDAPDEMETDLRGMAYHEAAHCKYTDFDALRELYKLLYNRWLKEFNNAIEDSRIELLMPVDFPGTRLDLERLNHKWRYKSDLTRFAKTDEGDWVTPWPVRLIRAMREVFDNKVPQMDEQTEPIIIKILPDLYALQDITNTRDLVLACEDIRIKINDIRESLYDNDYELTDEELEEALKAMQGLEGDVPLELDPNRKNKPAKEAVGQEQLDPAMDVKFDESESKSESDVDSESESDSHADNSDTGKGKPNASLSAEKEGSEKGEGESGEDESGDSGNGSASDENKGNAEQTKAIEPNEAQLEAQNEVAKTLEGQKSTDKEAGEEEAEATYVDTKRINTAAANWKDSEIEQQMLEDNIDDDSEFDNHIFSSESYVAIEIEKAVAQQETKDGYYMGIHETKDIDGNMVSVPFSREYDEVIDYKGQGDPDLFSTYKDIVSPVVQNVTTHLERVLKVKENVRIRTELERGKLNSRTLFRVGTDHNYRTPFKETSHTETKNVAVSLVFDCSGSMGGTKMEVARQTGLAIGLALNSLNIAFEATGFNTKQSAELSKAFNEAALTDAEASRFTRKSTALRLMIFKPFDSRDLSGICKAQSSGANEDGESIVWSAKRLAQRKEKRKIMIVLSDGQPAGETPDNILAGDLKRVIKLLPLSGIEPIGIGIQTDAPKDFYPDWIRVTNVQELTGLVMNKLAGLLMDVK